MLDIDNTLGINWKNWRKIAKVCNEIIANVERNTHTDRKNAFIG